MLGAPDIDVVRLRELKCPLCNEHQDLENKAPQQRISTFLGHAMRCLLRHDRGEPGEIVTFTENHLHIGNNTYSIENDLEPRYSEEPPKNLN